MSEWLMFQSILNGYQIPSVVIKITTIVCGAIVALTGALVATCFVKAFGISFLAMPRSDHARHAKEVPVVMYVSMGLLAGLCVFMGIFPAKIMMTVNLVCTHLLDINIGKSLMAYDWMQTKIVETNFTALSPKSATVLGLMILAATLGALTLTRPRFVKRVYETWTCGISPEPRLEYTATAFTRPFKTIFSNLYRPQHEVRTEFSVPNYFIRSITYISGVTPLFENYFYGPVARFVLSISTRVKWVHTGSIHIYLTYIFITLIILILFVGK